MCAPCLRSDILPHGYYMIHRSKYFVTQNRGFEVNERANRMSVRIKFFALDLSWEMQHIYHVPETCHSERDDTGLEEAGRTST